jgi:hypothetical protein
MKITVPPFLFLVLLGAMVVGCGGEAERKTSTDGADAQAIADYEAAVAASEQGFEQDEAEVDAEAEAEE